ncbi:MAG: dihydrolipoyl dehydrogenase [Kiritimatiellae bacterium]|nr:dihydrolipoyl dehydrogenase [Kiritimatiellia bacterium]MDW8458111.1 dihydrolipoyl dehydrogenase [Verrucomicrobiota bacterium]
MYDLIVIGAGPGGYVAAERAGSRGLRVLLIEQAKLGGVCLNEGCIPSKTLLNSAKLYHYAVHGEAYGVRAANVSFDWAAAQARKEEVMKTLRNGIAGLMKKYKVDVLFGSARLVGPRTVAVNGQTHEGRAVILATGSSPARPPIPGIDLPGVVDSTGLLNLERLPRSLVVIGGGVIGCEFACCFGSLGVPVTVIEMMPEICPQIDAEISRTLRAELSKKNIEFHVSAKVLEITADSVRFEKGGKEQSVPRDIVLVSTGRVPNVKGLGLEEARIEFDRRGIRVDDRCATNQPGVYAIGDCTGRAWLAHTASRMGEVVVNNLTGRPDRMRWHAIPGVVYTNPEVAVVGLSEADAAARGIPVKVVKWPMTANGRFLAEHAAERGLAKMVVHADTGVLLGAHLIGGACSEMIFGCAALIELEARVPEIEELVFPHPTASETMRDAVFSLH